MPLYDKVLRKDQVESVLDDLLVLLWGAYEMAERRGHCPSDAPLERRWLYHLGIGKDIIARALKHDLIQASTRPSSCCVGAAPLFEASSLVTLTEAGAVRAWQAICSRHGKPDSKPRLAVPAIADKPKWDKKTGNLYCGPAVLLTVRRPSSFQWLLLDAFQQRHWHQRIEDPLALTRGYRHGRLLQTVKDLNRRQKPRRLRFVVEADGQSVCWHWLP